MNPIVSFLRFAIYTIIFALLVGIKNLQNKPILWGFLVVIALARLYEVFSPAAKALKNYRKEEDQSRWTTWVIGISFFTNLIAPMLEYRYKLWPDLPPTQWWNWLGLLLLIAGSMLRIWAMQQAGDAFVPHVKVDPKLKLVTGGPYGYVRHPSYIATFISYLGIAILFNSIIGSIALVVLIIPAIFLRVIKEEKLLASRFGEAWKKYQIQTPARLIPSVW
jgi:protein-S-isoprenylcysteine O-methyltransferase Ste14